MLNTKLRGNQYTGSGDRAAASRLRPPTHGGSTKKLALMAKQFWMRRILKL